MLALYNESYHILKYSADILQMWLSTTAGLFVYHSEKPDPKRAPLVPLPMPKKLYFHIDREIKRDIEHAKQNLDM